MPLGQGALGLGVSYALAVGYLLLMRFMGAILSRQYPEEHKVVWDTRTISRVTILAAVSRGRGYDQNTRTCDYHSSRCCCRLLCSSLLWMAYWRHCCCHRMLPCKRSGRIRELAPDAANLLVRNGSHSHHRSLCRQKDNIVLAIVVGTIVNTVTCLGPWANHDRHASDDCAASISDHWICG